MAQPSQPPDTDVRAGDDIDEVLSRANPNPERIGCLPREALIGLARRAQPLGDPAYEHLVKCSPCYRQFRTLQEEQAQRRAAPLASSRGRWTAAAAAAVLVAGLVGLWFSWGPPSSQGGAAPVSQSQVAEMRTELDLRKYAVSRSEQAAPDVVPVSLPVGVVDLTLLLPVGSEPGAYDIQILDSVKSGIL